MAVLKVCNNWPASNNREETWQKTAFRMNAMEQNRCNDIAHTFPYTIDLDYVTLDTKLIVACYCWLLNTEQKLNLSGR
jgi:hypothetical protein